MSIPEIRELHASLLWTERAPSLPGAKAPMAFLGDRKAFAGYFNGLQAALARRQPLSGLAPADRDAFVAVLGSPAPGAGALAGLHWAPPWEVGQHVHGRYFWHYYLGGIPPKAVSGEAAWAHLVPLRLRLPLRAAGPAAGGGTPAVRIFADGYVYPHGSAVEIKLRLLYGGSSAVAPRALSDLLQLFNHPVSVCLPGGKPRELRLQTLAAPLLDYLRGLAWGKTASREAFHSDMDPLWVITVVKGSIADKNAPLVAGTDLHQVLDGFCTFRPDWASVAAETLPPLDKANLLIGNSAGWRVGGQTAGHIVYHRPRSRLVWMPEYFTAAELHFFKLSCYHRNLVLLSLQTEMLAHALLAYESSSAKPAALKKLASAAGQRLVELYGSQKDKTYVSASPRVYLDEMDDARRRRIDAALQALKIPALKWTPWGAAVSKT
jgi:hypothetical protein